MIFQWRAAKATHTHTYTNRMLRRVQMPAYSAMAAAPAKTIFDLRKNPWSDETERWECLRKQIKVCVKKHKEMNRNTNVAPQYENEACINRRFTFHHSIEQFDFNFILLAKNATKNIWISGHFRTNDRTVVALAENVLNVALLSCQQTIQCKFSFICILLLFRAPSAEYMRIRVWRASAESTSQAMKYTLAICQIYIPQERFVSLKCAVRPANAVCASKSINNASFSVRQPITSTVCASPTSTIHWRLALAHSQKYVFLHCDVSDARTRAHTQVAEHTQTATKVYFTFWNDSIHLFNSFYAFSGKLCPDKTNLRHSFLLRRFGHSTHHSFCSTDQNEFQIAHDLCRRVCGSASASRNTTWNNTMPLLSFDWCSAAAAEAIRMLAERLLSIQQQFR